MTGIDASRLREVFCLQRKASAAILALCLLLVCAAPAAEVGAFLDVEPNSWYTEAVSYVVENGYFNGVS